ncbi:MAG TPA: histidine kinase dimerization/phosphoacceptor domain -containing protein [Rectinemataceae bacterium]|nr:histidine kinase dimerization/phosphoacceptor domain -containing protein [Rectinemataceae bacterium]
MKKTVPDEERRFLESALIAVGALVAGPQAQPAPLFRDELSMILGLLDVQRSSVRDDLVSASLEWVEERVFTILAIHEICLAFEHEDGVPFQELCENLISRIIASGGAMNSRPSPP